MNLPQLANRRECTGCLACVDSCRHDALKHYVAEDGHYYVRIVEKVCVGCLQCERTCPIVSKLKYGESECATFYAAWNEDDEERTKSASGGAFTAMARYVIGQGGVVVGAVSENVCDVRHVMVSDVAGLRQLQGSKYTQSDASGIYMETYKNLKEGKLVLFSGTGCQVGGLRSFLRNKKYGGRLITVDLICGGVPSKLLLQKFAANESYKVKRIISYRTKEHGWKPKGFVYNLKVEDANGKIHDYTDIRNLVTTGFSTELTERYSCYQCKFVGIHRMSDFTIGDLWGDKEFPDQHYKGLSLVIAHNEWADGLLKDMTAYLHAELCNKERAVEVNFRLVNGRNVRRYTVERRLMTTLFNNCSYQTLKILYADDYSVKNIWTLLNIVRRIYIKFMKFIMS